MDVAAGAGATSLGGTQGTQANHYVCSNRRGFRHWCRQTLMTLSWRSPEVIALKWVTKADSSAVVKSRCDTDE